MVICRALLFSELTCCAEEGIRAAQLRKETKYTQLVSDINETKVWKASLRTLEIGARGLVGISSHKVFVESGFSSIQARALCRKLSAVVVRCSYAVYQAHNNLAWSHGIDLIIEEKRSSGKHETAKTDPGKTAMSTEERSNLGVKNIVVLRENGIRSLYQFTDASNLESIRAH